MGSCRWESPYGVIAAGLENGDLVLWDPAKNLVGRGYFSITDFANTTHTDPIRGLDFKPTYWLLVVLITRTLKSPMRRAQSWNQDAQTCKENEKWLVLADGGGARTLAGQVGSGTGMGRRGMSYIAWHPDNATRVIPASEDDSSPIIMVWDLRNARAPEKVRFDSVLSLCADRTQIYCLLAVKISVLSVGTLRFPKLLENLSSANNWAFQVDWCPRVVGIHSIQSTMAPIFSICLVFPSPSKSGTLSLKQPPKWFHRSASSAFGFDGKLITTFNLASSQGKLQQRCGYMQGRYGNDISGTCERASSSYCRMGIAVADIRRTEDRRRMEKALLSLFKVNSRERANNALRLFHWTRPDPLVRKAQLLVDIHIKSKESLQRPNTFNTLHPLAPEFASTLPAPSQDYPLSRSAIPTSLRTKDY